MTTTEFPSGYYAVTVRTIREVDGWTSTRHSPTFYLHSHVQGIRDEDHAARIAVGMFSDALPDGDDAQILAHVVFIGT